MTQNGESKTCQSCGAVIIFTDVAGWVHEGGGAWVQRCPCGMVGGQIGGFKQCPRCGDATKMVNDHIAQ